MKRVAVLILLACLVISTATLHAIEKHVQLGAVAVATIALEAPPPVRAAPHRGVVPASLISDASPAGEVARFTEGHVMVNGSKLTVIEDREARVVLYMVGAAITAVHLPAPEGVCEEESLDDTGIRTVRN